MTNDWTPETKTQIIRFTSWSEYVKQASEGKRTPGCSDSSTALESTRGRGSWYGTEDMTEAVKLANDGWREGREAINAIARRLEARLIHHVVREDVNYDVEGMSFDMARYVNGEPEHWLRPEDSQVTSHGSKHARIVFNQTVSCGISAEVIRARGAAVAALVDLLEYAGHRVEVWIVDCLADRTQRFECWTRVKAYDQPVDSDRLAFALVHPSSFRRLGFGMQEQAEASIVSFVGNYGYGIPADPKPESIEEGSIYLGRGLFGEPAWTSPEAAEAWILGQLAAQGIVLRDD